MNGNAGDDTLVWNNGDGNDQMNGGDGLDRIENNLGAANDVSALSVVGGKVHYARTNAPFTLDVATSEVFELNTFGGDDTLTTGPGLGALIAVVADAGSGNDTFTGGDESDHVLRRPRRRLARPGPRHRRRGRRPGRQRHPEGARRRGRPRPRRRRHGQRDGRPRGHPRRRRDQGRDRGPARARHAGHGRARAHPPHHVEAQEGRLHGQDPGRVPGLRAGWLLRARSRCRRRARSRSAARAFRALVAVKRYHAEAGQRKTLKVKLPKGVRALSRRARCR